MPKGWQRLVPLLFLIHFGASCASPSCFDLTYLPQNDKPLVSLTLYSEPIQEPRSATDAGGWRWFQSGSRIVLYDNGRMMVYASNSWGEHCPSIPQADLIELSSAWEPIDRKLVRQPAHRPTLMHIMADPDIWSEDWRPDGPLLELHLTAPSGRKLTLLWDGSALSPDFHAPVMRTLEIACSNSPRARKYLLRDLPPQVSRSLECN